MSEEQKQKIRKLLTEILVIINDSMPIPFVGPHPPHPPKANEDEPEERV